MNKTQVQAISKDKTNIRWKTFIVICGNDYVFISFKVLAVESGVMLSGTFPYAVTMMWKQWCVVCKSKTIDGHTHLSTFNIV